MLLIKRLIFTLFLACVTTSALSDSTRVYSVQVVVFSHMTPQTLSAEQWPTVTPDLTIPSTILPMHAANALQNEINALRKNGEYQVLMSGSWVTTWHNDQGTIVLPLSNGSNLQGSLTVTLGHYFDVKTNVFFTAPTSQLQKMDTSGYFSHISQPTFTFQYTEDRRMKSDELNYLGQPVLGILVKILKG